MEQRENLLSKHPIAEGKWLVTSFEPFSIALLQNELIADLFVQGMNLKTAYYNCLGREIIEKSL